MATPDESPPDGDDGGIVEASYDWDETPPATAVVETVAVALDRKPITLDPLFDSVNPDALNALFVSSPSTRSAIPTTVSFEFVGRYVTVSSVGTVTVREPTADGG